MAVNYKPNIPTLTLHTLILAERLRSNSDGQSSPSPYSSNPIPRLELTAHFVATVRLHSIIPSSPPLPQTSTLSRTRTFNSSGSFFLRISDARRTHNTGFKNRLSDNKMLALLPSSLPIKVSACVLHVQLGTAQ